jgi:predicted DNA-binding WGR domain protein
MPSLIRTDHARRMARFYVLDVQPDLFGAWCFIRERGRIGRPGQLRYVPYPTEDEAKEALARQRRAKERAEDTAARDAVPTAVRRRNQFLQCSPRERRRLK